MFIQKRLLLLTILLASLCQEGCAVLKERNLERINCDIPEDPCNTCPTPKPDCAKLSIEAQLLATAQSIEQSLNTLAAAQKAESPPILNTAPLTTPEGGMGNNIDIDWTGPIGPLVDKIARLTDYRVKFLGNEPAIPILVTITARKTMTADVLQNASLQAGKRAQILVYPSNRVIEVRYLS